VPKAGKALPAPSTPWRSAPKKPPREKGAIDAFVRFTVLLEQAYASAPELA
jgi:hypothetical protein